MRKSQQNRIFVVLPMQLERIITDLLKEHNCVIVPDFGGFIGNYESAWINRSRHIIYPPFKQILFNTKLIQSDGLLVHTTSQTLAMDYTEASLWVTEEVKRWKKELSAGKRIDLGEAGFLFREQEQILFEQNREVNLLLQAFGLHQITYQDFAAETPEMRVAEKEIPKKIPAETLRDRVKTNPKQKSETPVIVLNSTEKIEPVQELNDKPVESTASGTASPKRRKGYKYALVAAAIVPALFYAYWIPAKTDFLNSGKIHLSDFNPLSEPVTAVYQKRTGIATPDSFENDWKNWAELTRDLPAELSIYNFEFSEDLYIPVRLKEDETTANGINTKAPFQVITGCFSVKANAENHIKDLSKNGISAAVLDQNKGLWRVSAGSFANQHEADLFSDKVKGLGYSAWILSK